MTCPHHWLVASAAALMPATCRDCGAEKVFQNFDASSNIQPPQVGRTSPEFIINHFTYNRRTPE